MQVGNYRTAVAETAILYREIRKDFSDKVKSEFNRSEMSVEMSQ